MKKTLLYTLAGLFLSVFLLNRSHAQGFTTLFVESMPGFPSLPGDTAYEGQSYQFGIILVNNTSQTVTGSISINMRVDSITSTIVTNPQLTIPPGDTVSFGVTGFNFTQPQFKMGNNIVVVWPVVNGLSVPVDSLYDNVFFVPLSSLGTPSPDTPFFDIFPVPASRLLYVSTHADFVIEYVRIYSIDGRLKHELPWNPDRILDIGMLAPGIWLIEIGNQSGRAVRKLIRE